MLQVFSVIVASYVIGCFTTGYYLVRCLTGADIREVSSGNVGSRNVGRLLGTKGFMITFAGDAGKGLLAVWLAAKASPESWVAYAALFAVTCGHIWPAQLRFRGGKGFATLAGGLLLLHSSVLAASLLLCAVLYPAIRGTTRTGLLVLACSPLLAVLVSSYRRTPFDIPNLVLYSLLVLVVLYAHRGNIRSELKSCFKTGA